MNTSEARSRLKAADVARLGVLGITTRRVRTALSALGIGIGIAAMVAVLGISQSSKAQLLAQLDRLGTNLLTVTPGSSITGDNATLPPTALAMTRRISSIQHASQIGDVAATVRRSDRIPPNHTGAISVYSTSPDLLTTVGAHLVRGRFIDNALACFPTVVLGADSAQRLGVDRTDGHTQLWIGDHWFVLVGILAPVPLAPELDNSALIGPAVAASMLDATNTAAEVYVRVETTQVAAVENLLAPTANPAHPEQVQVSRPSDLLAARANANTAFTALFLGLGAVALFVGGVGIANVMVISVLERRGEIGLRRALGATRTHIAAQFLTESTLLATVGGVTGVALGAGLTAGYAHLRGWPTSIPPAALIGALAAAIVIGALAGSYPAGRAARLSPTDALRNSQRGRQHFAVGGGKDLG